MKIESIRIWVKLDARLGLGMYVQLSSNSNSIDIHYWSGYRRGDQFSGYSLTFTKWLDEKASRKSNQKCLSTIKLILATKVGKYGGQDGSDWIGIQEKAT